MSEQDIQENKSPGFKKGFLAQHWKKIILISALLIVIAALIWAVVYFETERRSSGFRIKW